MTAKVKSQPAVVKGTIFDWFMYESAARAAPLSNTNKKIDLMNKVERMFPSRKEDSDCGFVRRFDCW